MTREEFIKKASVEMAWRRELTEAFIDHVGGWEEFQERTRQAREKEQRGYCAHAQIEGFCTLYEVENLEEYAPEIAMHMIMLQIAMGINPSGTEEALNIRNIFRFRSDEEWQKWMWELPGDKLVTLIQYAADSLASLIKEG